MSKEKKKEEPIKALPIEWHIPEGIVTPFATNMLVQTIEHEFKLSFFEVKTPIRFAESDPVPSAARADLITSVIVSAHRMPKFIEALQNQYDKYKAKKD